MECKILGENTIQDMEAQINLYFKKGFKLYGDLQTGSSQYGFYCTQVMIKGD